MTFDDRFCEVENYAARGERFYSQLPSADHSRIKQWLQAAFDAGAGVNNRDLSNKCPTCGIVFHHISSYYCPRSDCFSAIRTS